MRTNSKTQKGSQRGFLFVFCIGSEICREGVYFVSCVKDCATPRIRSAVCFPHTAIPSSVRWMLSSFRMYLSISVATSPYRSLMITPFSCKSGTINLLYFSISEFLLCLFCAVTGVVVAKITLSYLEIRISAILSMVSAYSDSDVNIPSPNRSQISQRPLFQWTICVPSILFCQSNNPRRVYFANLQRSN